MRQGNVMAFSISLILILAAPVLAQSPGKAQATTPRKAGPGQPVFTPAGDLKWTDLDPKGAPGVKVADLWGNHAKGAFGAYLKLPRRVTAFVCAGTDPHHHRIRHEFLRHSRDRFVRDNDVYVQTAGTRA